MIRLLLYALLAAGAAALADLLGRRLAARGDCGLHRAVILPDSCRGRCPPGQRCVAFQTRGHWLFGTQAAGCGCIAAGFGGGPLTPPDFADPPRRLEGPAPGSGRPPAPSEPETTPEAEEEKGGR